ncbi:MAG: N-6 DNA methylase [Gemmatimonadota bacterium]|nr:N-6 DNA methylase [Gemmatimonadota bacterium]MDE2984528.1 N-6 DNA methylase [Gemmatimonadota bacterium]
MAKRLPAQVRDHLEWLGFIQPTGLVVSAHALVQAGAILNRRDIEGQRLLAECVEERCFRPGREPEPFLPDFERFARHTLGWSFSPKGYAGMDGCPIPRDLELRLPEYSETLVPDFAVKERDPRDGCPPWQLLVSVIDPGTDPDRATVGKGGLEASPHGRLERLLRGTRVPAGVLFNGRVIRLVSAPRGETSGWMDFRVNDMLPTAGRPLCAALRLLLLESRLLALPEKKRLAGLLEESRKYQNVVSERLSEQVLHGLHELLRGFQSAHEKSHGELLAHELEQDPDNVYRALLTVMLRLVFVLYAEERGLLSEDATFGDHYSVGGLYERLREEAGLYPDTMDDRYGAWAQLVVLFRMVHDGAKSGGMRLPARRGELFSPSRFPFLEGWHGSGAPQVTQAIKVPLVPDGTIYRVLDKLLVLDGERISYRALDVEQIGSVYETMMGFRLETATGRSVAIRAHKKGGASTTVNLEELAEVEPGARAKWVRERTERKLTATVTKPLKAAEGVTELHAALAKVVDTAATPDLVPRGAMILQPSDERRRSGSHYTPRELTEPIVRKALEPVLHRMGNGRGPRPSELLDLKICDPTMGSGAFLVEACRQLADELVESWKRHGGRPEVPPGEDELVLAGRMVAQKCLYGVDRNPMAVDLAKMSLWLATLAKDEALTFVDHALRDGDSLVGLTRRQISAFTWKTGALPLQLELNTRVSDAVDRVVRLREEIREAGPGTPQWELEDKWEQVEAALKDVRLFGDLAVEAFFLETKVKSREARRVAHLAAVQDDDTKEHRERLEAKRKANPVLAPFHWEIEFPEVFERTNPGFDVFVGNPPFAGKNTVAAATIDSYPLWLKELHAKSHGNSDLVAHFFRRVFDLLRDGGTFGLIATNTIGQGDTRSTGLRWICQNGGEIYWASTRYTWPGQAAVVVSVVHAAKGEFLVSKHLDGRPVDEITAFLFHTGGHDDPVKLEANEDQSFQGSIVLGMGFTFDDTDTKGVASPLSEMRRLIEKDSKNAEAIFPYIGGSEVNTSPTHEHRRYVINFREYPLRRADLGEQWEDADGRQRTVWLRSGIVPADYPDPVAQDWPDLLKIVEDKVKPARVHLTQNAIGRKRAKFWWQYGSLAKELQTAIAGLERVLFHGFTCQHMQFAFLDRDMVYAGPHNVFALGTYAAFCALQSRPHEIWARFFGSSLKDDLRYTPSDVYETFPFPPGWTTHTALEAAGQAYYDFRADLMVMNNEGLTKTYNRFHDPDERDPDIAELRRLHAAMDEAVLAAYGWTGIPTRCEFLPDHSGENDEPASGPSKRRYRYRCGTRCSVVS